MNEHQDDDDEDDFPIPDYPAVLVHLERTTKFVKLHWANVYRLVRVCYASLAFPILFVIAFNLLDLARLQAIAILSDLVPSAPYDGITDPHRVLVRGHIWSEVRWLSTLALLLACYAFCHVASRLTVILENRGRKIYRRSRYDDLIIWFVCSVLPLLTMFRLTLSALGRYGFGMYDPAFAVGGLFLLLIPVEYFHLRIARPSPTKAFLIFAITVPTLVAILGTTRGNLLFADPGAEVEVATIVGPFVALLVALSGVTLGVFLLAHSSNRMALPVFGAVLFWAFVLAWTDSNDNHPVRLQKDRDRAICIKKQPLDVVDDERLWIYDDDIPLMLSRWRQDIVGSFRRPIVVVSAEGGGIRAAYFTATALGRIADKCPVIAREMLTVSGVSGGAVGVAAYALAVRTKPISPNDQTCISRERDEVILKIV